jgi:hypothetical protein
MKGKRERMRIISVIIVFVVMKDAFSYQFPSLVPKISSKMSFFKMKMVHGAIEKNHPLKKLLQRVHQTFSIHGESDELKNIQIQLTTNGSCGTLQHPDISKLLPISVVSPFGKGNTTVYDENVRKGREISAEQLAESTKASLDKLIHDTILREIKQSNVPTFLGPNITVKFYKMAIYEKGGHFQTHRDTVHSSDHKATLLIEVRADHKGGTLQLNKNGVETEWKLASPEKEEEKLHEFMIDPTKPQKLEHPNEIYRNQPLKWILFYTDIEHSISPVTEGVRMVLQFDVYDHKPTEDGSEDHEEDYDEDYEEYEYYDIFGKSKKLPRSSAACAKEEEFSKVITLLKNQTTSAQALVVPCYFLYISPNILPQQLKSIDKQLFDNFVKAGFPVVLVPVDLKATTDYEGYFSAKGEYFVDIADPPFQVYQQDPSTHEMVSKVVKYVPSGFQFKYIVSGLEAAELYDSSPRIEWVGNEAVPGDNRYKCGAMVVFKPLGE